MDRDINSRIIDNWMALIFFFLINIDSAHTVAEMTAQTLPLFTTNRLQSGPKLTLTAHSYKKNSAIIVSYQFQSFAYSAFFCSLLFCRLHFDVRKHFSAIFFTLNAKFCFSPFKTVSREHLAGVFITLFILRIAAYRNLKFYRQLKCETRANCCYDLKLR